MPPNMQMQLAEAAACAGKDNQAAAAAPQLICVSLGGLLMRKLGGYQEIDMAALPDVIWGPTEFHAHLIRELDAAYRALQSERPDFEALWVAGRPLPGYKTNFRQAPMLGIGAGGRDRSGFVNFGRAYCAAEGRSWTGDRCSFERYADFVLYTGGDWYQGEKVPLMVAEAETNSAELLGELNGLVSLRAPHKYLFIDPHDTLGRLDAWTQRDGTPCDWPSTTYHVIEIPGAPALPSTWVHYTATVRDHRLRLAFEIAATA